jgi:DNA-directed RNA polymerase subunit RPC12/RpoP
MTEIIKEALPLLVVPIDDASSDETERTAECPHCQARGLSIVREIDEAVRWNDGELEIEDGKIVSAWWSTGDSDFHHARYECSNCGDPVLLPDDIDEDWS